jgi:hypothetical protein
VAYQDEKPAQGQPAPPPVPVVDPVEPLQVSLDGPLVFPQEPEEAPDSPGDSNP